MIESWIVAEDGTSHQHVSALSPWADDMCIYTLDHPTSSASPSMDDVSMYMRWIKRW
jgi:hypothetical protein